MTIIRLILKELVGMFIDDGSLATLALLLIVAITAAVNCWRCRRSPAASCFCSAASSFCSTACAARRGVPVSRG
ncbi:hypothetical protein [Mesorhizobium caraganae]|uniref:hypothetical protein n=1 Tax=Mesorhizobium caraganae TaxID=483206 RepID=UPI00333B2BF3